MKTKTTLIVAIILITVGAFYSMNQSDLTTGPHGGMMQQVDKYKIELKTNAPTYYTYLYDSKGNAINNEGITCEMRLFFFDSTTMDVTFKPYQKDGFVLQTSLAGCNSYRINYNVYGETVSAKFEAESAIVSNKKIK